MENLESIKNELSGAEYALVSDGLSFDEIFTANQWAKVQIGCLYGNHDLGREKKNEEGEVIGHDGVNLVVINWQSEDGTSGCSQTGSRGFARALAKCLGVSAVTPESRAQLLRDQFGAFYEAQYTERDNQYHTKVWEVRKVVEG